MITQTRWLLPGGTAAAIWIFDATHTILVYGPARFLLGRSSAVLVIVIAFGIIADYTRLRIEGAIDRVAPPAVELGRRLERLRRDASVVLPFHRRRPMGR